MKPFIGITPDYSYETERYALHGDYAAAVQAAGGCPVLLLPPWEPPDFPDGILLSGGGDLDPLLFGEEPLRESGGISPLRDGFELPLCRRALAEDIPLLGICRGMQVMNVAAGGSILQDIAAQSGSPLKHCQEAPRSHATHGIFPEEGSLLAALWGKRRIAVNSFHHQAVNRLGRGFRAAAYSPDGLTEAIERQDGAFALGVQWHPEAMKTEEQALLFSAFVKAAAERQKQRRYF